jgi:PiT family inorganic phosphate transporter
VGVLIAAFGAAVVIGGIFLWSRRDEVSHRNVLSEVADSGRAVKIKRNPAPKRKVSS